MAERVIATYYFERPDGELIQPFVRLTSFGAVDTSEALDAIEQFIALKRIELARSNQISAALSDPAQPPTQEQAR